MSDEDEVKKQARDILEKRRFERFKAGLQVRFRVLHPDEKRSLLRGAAFVAPVELAAKATETQDFKQVLSEDISLGGLRISTPYLMPRGVELWMTVSLPGVPMPVSGIAVVKWSRPGGGGYQSGLQFSGISSQELARVEAFLSLQKKQG